jgi:uncharacterized protein YjiS (DUF1127 family)
MEQTMPGNRTFDFTFIDDQSLSPQQREALVQRVIREARADRARAIQGAVRSLPAWLWKAVSATGSAIARLGRAFADRRRHGRQMAELQALSDYELKDIGMRRSEIYWVVHNGRDIPAVRVPEQRARIVRPDPMTATTARPAESRRHAHGTAAAA